jgi:8-oxo-dGTP pyrophosphatase MutT (NUDIX family)
MASWAIIEREGRILLIKRSPNTSRPGQWCFPGGGIKVNESAKQACIREAKEETGLDIDIYELVAEIENSHYFNCCLQNIDQEISLAIGECDDYQWIKPSELLQVGFVMDLKLTYRILSLMGYQIELNEEAQKIIN